MQPAGLLGARGGGCKFFRHSAPPSPFSCGAGPGCVDWAEVAAILNNPVYGCTMNCHSADLATAGLDLTSMEAAKAGGLHGAAVVACDPMSSYLYLKTAWTDWPPALEQFGTQMPPAGAGPVGLSPSELDTIYQWINTGAQDICVVDACQ